MCLKSIIDTGDLAASVSAPPSVSVRRHELHQLSVIVLVCARLGVSYLVEAGHFKSVGVPPLSFVHVVPEGQHHLQELAQSPALHHLSGR